MPVMMLGMARGSCTLTSICHGVAPKSWLASSTSRGTWRLPKFVRRTDGGVAQTSVANTAGTLPMPKNMRAGTRYTKAGMVCIMSKMGRTTASTRSFLAHRIPNGTPMATANVTELSMRARVVMARSQSSMLPIRYKPTADNRAPRQPATRHIKRATRAMRTGHGSHCRKSSVVLSSVPITWRMPRNSGAKLATIQSTPAFIHCPTGKRTNSIPVTSSGPRARRPAVCVIAPGRGSAACALRQVARGLAHQRRQHRHPHDDAQQAVALDDRDGKAGLRRDGNQLGQRRTRGYPGKVLPQDVLEGQVPLGRLHGVVHRHDARDPVAVLQHKHAGQPVVAHDVHGGAGPGVQRDDRVGLEHDLLGRQHAGRVDVLHELGHVLVGRTPQDLFRRPDL